MTYLLFALWLLLHPGQIMFGVPATGSGGGATFTYVATAKSDSGSPCGGSPCTISYSGTAGHELIIDYWVDSISSPTISGYDDGGSSYSVAIANSNSALSGAYFGEVYTCVAASGIANIGLTISAAFTDANFVVTDYSYTGGTCAIDQVSSLGTSGSGTTITAGSITTSIANELIHGGLFQYTTAQPITATAPYTNRNDVGCGGCTNINTVSSLDDIVSATGTYAATGTVGASTTWYGYTVSYK